MPLRRLRRHLRRHPHGSRRTSRRRRHEAVRTTSRPPTRAAAIDAVSQAAARQVPRRRHQPDRSDAREHRAAGRAGRHHPSSAVADRRSAPTAASRIGAACATPPSPPIRRSASATRCCREAILCGASGAAPQHGHGRRQPDAADALLLLLRPAARCNKRQPGSGCDAIDGFNRMHAILGASDALHRDASVGHVRRAGRARRDGPASPARTADADDPVRPTFHRLPGDTPHIETNLQAGELITVVDLPPLEWARAASMYRKVRDRASYAFALVQRRRGAARRRWRRSGTCVSRSAAWRTSRGAPSRPSAVLRRRRADADAASHRRPTPSLRRPRGRGAQRIQDRAGEAHDRRRARRAGRTRRCAMSVMQTGRRAIAHVAGPRTATSCGGASGYIGQPLDRVDGAAKVTGAARFTAEYPVRGPRARRRSCAARSPRAASQPSIRAARRACAGRHRGDHPRQRAAR